MNDRSWQEPLEFRLGSNLVSSVPQDLSAILHVIETDGVGLILNSYSPEKSNAYINADISLEALSAIHGIFQEFKNRKMPLVAVSVMVFWNGDAWEQRIRYEYEKDDKRCVESK